MLIKNINFYTIVDTNWLMNQENLEIHFAKTPYYPPSDISKKYRYGTVIFPMCIIVPKQIKSEILTLSRRRDKEYEKIARAKKHYTHLMKYFTSDVDLYTFYVGNSLNTDLDDVRSKILTMREFDLNKVPYYKVREKELGPDSPTDKGVMALAYNICKHDPSASCFVATYDTGLQVEIAHLFFRENIRVGCYQIINDWRKTLKKRADELLTNNIREEIRKKHFDWMDRIPQIEEHKVAGPQQECQCQC